MEKFPAFIPPLLLCLFTLGFVVSGCATQNIDDDYPFERVKVVAGDSRIHAVVVDGKSYRLPATLRLNLNESYQVTFVAAPECEPYLRTATYNTGPGRTFGTRVAECEGEEDDDMDDDEIEF